MVLLCSVLACRPVSEPCTCSMVAAIRHADETPCCAAAAAVTCAITADGAVLVDPDMQEQQVRGRHNAVNSS